MNREYKTSQNGAAYAKDKNDTRNNCRKMDVKSLSVAMESIANIENNYHLNLFKTKQN